MSAGLIIATCLSVFAGLVYLWECRSEARERRRKWWWDQYKQQPPRHE